MTPRSFHSFNEFLVVLIALLAWSSPAWAVDTYEDRSGRFLADLPNGYSDQQSQYSDNFLFVRDENSPQIIMVFLSDNSDTDAVFAESVNNIEDSIENVRAVERVRMTVNGNPARWGRFQGSVSVQDQEVPLYAVSGAVTLAEGSLYLMGFLNDTNRKEWEPRLREIFETIREIGAPVTGATDVQPMN